MSEPENRLASDAGRQITPREAEVLQLIALGLETRGISERLKITPKTVDRHVQNLKVKMHAQNRANMVALAFTQGLLMPVQPLVGQIDSDEAAPE